MKQIRFSITNLADGGAEKILINILKCLSRDKYHISLFLFEKSGVYLKNIPHDVDVNYFIHETKNSSWLLSLFGKIFRTFAFRVFMYFPGLVYRLCGIKYCDIDISYIQDTTYLLKANHAKKKIAWIHTNILNSPTYKRGLEQNLACADKIISVSQGATDIINKSFSDFKNRTMTIYNPSPLSEISKLSESHHVVFLKPTIVGVGKLKKVKGFDILIKSFKLIIERGFDWNLVILGDGELRDELESLINELSISDHVQLLGFKENPYSYMAKADLFVLSSYFEGFGQVVVEAQYLGIPIVSTDCDVGPREILHDGECGLLVPVGSIEKLAAGIEQLMTDQQLRDKFIAKGIKRAQDFDLPKVMTQVEDLFDEI